MKRKIHGDETSKRIKNIIKMYTTTYAWGFPDEFHVCYAYLIWNRNISAGIEYLHPTLLFRKKGAQ